MARVRRRRQPLDAETVRDRQRAGTANTPTGANQDVPRANEVDQVSPTIRRIQEIHRDRAASNSSPANPDRAPSATGPANPDRTAGTPSLPGVTIPRAPTAETNPSAPRVFRSRDGLVTYNERGQRLDSVGNVARRTNQSRQRDANNRRAAAAATPAPAPSDERAVGLRTDRPIPTSGEEGDGGPAPFSGPAPSFQDALGAEPTAAAAAANPLAGLNLSGTNQVIELLQNSGVNSDDFFRSADFAEALRRWELQFQENQRQAAFGVAGRAQLPNSRFI